jgi:hypothetical protein
MVISRIYNLTRNTGNVLLSDNTKEGLCGGNETVLRARVIESMFGV